MSSSFSTVSSDGKGLQGTQMGTSSRAMASTPGLGSDPVKWDLMIWTCPRTSHQAGEQKQRAPCSDTEDPTLGNKEGTRVLTSHLKHSDESQHPFSSSNPYPKREDRCSGIQLNQHMVGE